MIPFPDIFYPDRIQIQRNIPRKSQGSSIRDYPNPPEPEIKASVQSKSISAADPNTGRTTTKTIHTVRTETNQAINTFDKLVWTDHNGITKHLIAEGPSTPKGIGDVQYLTECVETI